MKIFDEICKDEEILNRYLEVERYENKNKGWAYHNFAHVNNVAQMVEKLLRNLNYDEQLIENAKIAAILHDTGANLGKEDHAYRSYLFAKEYLERKQYPIENKEEILEAIKIHSHNFNTNSILALTIILSDKLDVKSNRISEEGRKVVGNRQYQYVKDIEVKIENENLIIQFLMDDQFDLVELEKYYFTKKIFHAITAFSQKVNLKPEVFINQKKWISSVNFIEN